MKKWMVWGTVILAAAILLAVVIVRRTPSLHTEEAVRTAVDAYIYGYPLITFDTARRQQTNVARAAGLSEFSTAGGCGVGIPPNSQPETGRPASIVAPSSWPAPQQEGANYSTDLSVKIREDFGRGTLSR